MELDWYKIEPYTKEKAEKAPDKNGVYMLCTKQQGGGYKVRYVGQGNIKERLLCHLSDNDTNKDLCAHIKKYKMKASYAEVGKQEDRDGIELFLYEKFNPKYNHIKPPGNKVIPVSLFSLDS